ncbi:MAG: hydrogenase [Polyangiaceae bacterium]|nr:hydrogenase [Polyangiaceae bacterium]
MALALVLVPWCFAAVIFAIRGQRARPYLVAAGTLVQAILVLIALFLPEVTAIEGWLRLDALGRLVLGTTTVLLLATAVYLPAYLEQHPTKSNRGFCTCMMAFAGVVGLMTQAYHLGLLWVGLEASTLAVAPLIYFHRTPRSLEAVWKYLLIGSVGIALALFGSFLLGYAVLHGGGHPSLLLPDLVASAPRMSRPWLHAALLVLLVGYGTKMGLAPMHTWKPDAYGEAPGVAGALLAGAVTNCAFLAVLRVHRVAVAAGEADFARRPLLALGLLSMLVAGIFTVRQKDYKRLLAYSSVEHMGILAIGIGIGGGAVFGALLHMVNNALAKGTLFLTAGNLHRAFGSKSTDQVRGAIRRVPASAALLLAGFFAITGSPPFGPFLSELTIVGAAIDRGHILVAGTFLALLAAVFVGMGATMLAVVQGNADGTDSTPPVREPVALVAPAACLLCLVLLLGLHVPEPLAALLREAAAELDAP